MNPAFKNTDIRTNLADTIAPMLTRNSGTSAGLVGRATRKRAEQIADAVLARINGESLHLVRFTPAPNAAPACCYDPPTVVAPLTVQRGRPAAHDSDPYDTITENMPDVDVPRFTADPRCECGAMSAIECGELSVRRHCGRWDVV